MLFQPGFLFILIPIILFFIIRYYIMNRPSNPEHLKHILWLCKIAPEEWSSYLNDEGNPCYKHALKLILVYQKDIFNYLWSSQVGDMSVIESRKAKAAVLKALNYTARNEVTQKIIQEE